MATPEHRFENPEVHELPHHFIKSTGHDSFIEGVPLDIPLEIEEAEDGEET